MVYEYVNAKLNVLERPFKRTATTVRERAFFPLHTLRELQLLEGGTEDKVPVCGTGCCVW